MSVHYATEIPGEAVAAVLTIITVIGVGLTSWMLVTMVRLTSVVASLEARIHEQEKTIERHEAFIAAGHPEHRR